MNTTDQPTSLTRRYGPYAVVTGASSGIGRHLALELAARGFHLVLVARHAEGLAAVAAAIQETSPREIRCLPIDLATPEGPEQLHAATADLDIGLVVLNAGFGTSGPFLDADPTRESEMIQLNCRAVLLSSHHFGRRLAARRGGCLMLVSSILAFSGSPLAAGYGATKAFVQALGESLRVELGAQGVDVLVAAPGPTLTGFADRAGMTLGNAMPAETVARAMVRSIGGRGTRFPGWLSKILKGLTGTLPRWAATLIFGNAMKGMTRGRA